jgi:excisionase family DNA binding protein
MEMLIIEKQALDELIYRIDMLETKLNRLFIASGIAPQKWMDNPQVALYLSVSKRTLQTLRDSGVLPFTKIGAKVFYKPEDIERMLLLGYKSMNN